MMFGTSREVSSIKSGTCDEEKLMAKYSFRVLSNIHQRHTTWPLYNIEQILFQGAGIGVSVNPYISLTSISTFVDFCSLEMFDIDSPYFTKLVNYYYNLKINWY